MWLHDFLSHIYRGTYVCARGARVCEVQDYVLLLEWCRVSIFASVMRVQGLEVKPWLKTWQSQRAGERMEHACLPPLCLPLADHWLPHCIAKGAQFQGRRQDVVGLMQVVWLLQGSFVHPQFRRGRPPRD